MTDCPFCPSNWGELDILDRTPSGSAVVSPLRPVTEGHVLVIHRDHTVDAAANPEIASDLMFTAALWVQRQGIEANIITSIGANATQTVRHTHLHVVPRRRNDDLPLPWTPQQMADEQWRRACRIAEAEAEGRKDLAEWEAYWGSLTPGERRDELKAMAEYAEGSDY